MRSSKVLSIFSVLSLVVSLVGIVLFFAGIRWAVAICAAVSLLNSVLQVFCGDQNNFITEIITLVFGGLIGALTNIGLLIHHLADSRRKMEFLFNTSACGYDINIDNLAAGSVFAYAYWVISGKVALPGECLYVNDYVHELMLKATYKTFDDKSGEELVGKASDWEATTGDIQNGNDPEAR